MVRGNDCSRSAAFSADVTVIYVNFHQPKHIHDISGTGTRRHQQAWLMDTGKVCTRRQARRQFPVRAFIQKDTARNRDVIYIDNSRQKWYKWVINKTLTATPQKR